MVAPHVRALLPRVFAYTTLALILTFPLVVHPASRLPGGGDTWLYYWNIWWLDQSILGAHVNPFFCPLLHHPYGASLYFHTLNLLPSVLALPVAALSSLALAYNLIVWVGFVLAGIAADALARDLLRAGAPRLLTPAERWAAFVAGCAFSFSAYHFAHLLGHLDMMATFWLPWFALALSRAARDGRPARVLLAAVVLAGTALTSWYYALIELVFASLLVAHRLLRNPSARGRVLARVGAILALGALLVSPLLVPMLVLGRTTGRVPDPWGDMLRFSADLLAFVTPSFLHPLWGHRVAPFQELLARNGNVVESSSAYLGLVALLLALYGLMCDRVRSPGVEGGDSAPGARFWWLVLVVFGCLALGPVLHIGGRPATVADHEVWLPYSLFARLPYGDIPRSLARFAVMTTLAVSLLAALGVRRALEGAGTTRRAWIGIGLVALVLFDNAAVPLPTSAVRVPAAYRWLGAQPAAPTTTPPARGALVEVPIPDDPFRYPPRMLYQTVHERPVFGGYLARALPPIPFPAIPGFAQLASLSAGVDDVVAYEAATLGPLSLAVLESYGAEFVVIDKQVLDQGALARARQAWVSMAARDQPAFEDQETLVYRVPRGATSPVAAVWLDRGWFYLEQRDGPPAARWRWMGAQSELRIRAPRSGSYALELDARALRHPRSVSIEIGATEVSRAFVGVDRAPVRTPAFDLAPGVHTIVLRSGDGAEVAGHGDRRALSIALFGLSLVEVH
jgi:hypothetical protein